MKQIYLDNAAATATDPRVISAMSRAARVVGNPSAFNDAGRQAAGILSRARRTIAAFLNGHESEVVFCASASEANTLALLGVSSGAPRKRRHLVTTPVEHLSVLQSAQRLVRQGWKVSYGSVDASGIVAVDDIMSRLTARTAIVSVMYANNEIGSIQPIAKLTKAVMAWRRQHNSRYPLVHVDACQAAAYLDMDVQRLGVDLMTFNGAKVYGPKGITVLYVRRGIELDPQVLGGSQERGRRAGTENIPAVVGLAKAVSLIRKSDASKVSALRDHFLTRLQVVIPDSRLNGPTGPVRLANNINISFSGTDSENLLLELDRAGIRAGSGSACTAQSVEPSHVLKAIGTPRAYLDGVIRFSLSRATTKRELDAVLKELPDVVRRVRARLHRVY